MLERISYRGWENAYRISNATVELVVLADVGPRIVAYALVGSENIFYEVPEQAGLTGGGEFRLYGGTVSGYGRRSTAPISRAILR